MDQEMMTRLWETRRADEAAKEAAQAHIKWLFEYDVKTDLAMAVQVINMIRLTSFAYCRLEIMKYLFYHKEDAQTVVKILTIENYSSF